MIIDRQEFEGVLEALDLEIEELPDSATKENLTDISSTLYGLFENLGVEDVDKIKEENDVLRQLLTAYLSYEDRLYIKIKYEIEL